MITSLLNECLKLKNDTPDKLQEYLHEINLTIFDPIFHGSQNLIEAQQSVLFILCAYSEDSPLQIIRQDNKIEKEAICEYLNIPEFLRPKLMDLSDQTIRDAVMDYLQQFAGPAYKAYKMLEIQVEDLNIAITTRKFKVNDAQSVLLYDFKEHAKAVTQYEMLLKRKNLLGRELSAQINLMDAIEDMKKYTRDAKDTGKMKSQRRGNVESAISTQA